MAPDVKLLQLIWNSRLVCQLSSTCE